MIAPRLGKEGFANPSINDECKNLNRADDQQVAIVHTISLMIAMVFSGLKKASISAGDFVDLFLRSVS